MDPITIAMSLAQFVPQITKWVTGSDKAEQVAQKAIEIAQTVTGKPTGDQALAALQADPALVLQYRQAVLSQEVSFQQLAVQNASDINKSIQTEAASEHWPTYSWRPAIGFSYALLAVLTGMTVVVAYLGVMFFNVKPEVLSYLPAMIASIAAIMAAMSTVLGVASWYRGKMQADPNIATVNRG
jgi:hypothetical protein